MRSLVLFAALMAPAAPLSWTKITPFADLTLTLPAQIRQAPDLYERLYRSEIKMLKRFAADASDPRGGQSAEAAQTGRQGRWKMRVDYTAGVETPRLVSFVRSSFEDTDGAHPNHTLGGVVFDKVSRKALNPVDLLEKGVDLGPLNTALCNAAKMAKLEKIHAWKMKEDPNFNCPTWTGLIGANSKVIESPRPPQIALVRSDIPGHAAGLRFLYSPYDLGAYVEGDFALVVPAEVFQRALKSQYREDFAGRPLPAAQDN